jgi:IS30 family transposase
MMTLKQEHLKAAKAALKSMSTRREKTLTQADFVASLVQDIHEKMTAGFSLEDICGELNKTLPDGKQLNMNTFKTYVRRARTEAGISPTRAWTRRADPAKTTINTTPDKNIPEVQKDNLETDFRDQIGEL